MAQGQPAARISGQPHRRWIDRGYNLKKRRIRTLHALSRSTSSAAMVIHFEGSSLNSRARHPAKAGDNRPRLRAVLSACSEMPSLSDQARNVSLRSAFSRSASVLDRSSWENESGSKAEVIVAEFIKAELAGRRVPGPAVRGRCAPGPAAASPRRLGLRQVVDLQ